MSLQERIRSLKDKPLPRSFQGVTKDRIRRVLKTIDRNSSEMVDVVFALLDDQNPSFFKKIENEKKFCEGATTQHIAAHVGNWQRGGSRLDREGRDYWIKPLRDIGAIEPIILNSETGLFTIGHLVPKSSNCCYRLSEDFVKILKASEEELDSKLEEWIQEDHVRARLEQQANLIEEAKKSVDNKHSFLIKTCQVNYAANFLPGYMVIYVDDGDGDRITEAQRKTLSEAGISLTLGDAMPDVLLWNRDTDSLWVIEAVTSDGEVDLHKVKQLTALAKRANKKAIHFTTAYQTWKSAASRQFQLKNLPPETYLWIMEDPTKHFLAMPPLNENEQQD